MRGFGWKKGKEKYCNQNLKQFFFLKKTLNEIVGTETKNKKQTKGKLTVAALVASSNDILEKETKKNEAQSFLDN